MKVDLKEILILTVIGIALVVAFALLFNGCGYYKQKHLVEFADQQVAKVDSITKSLHEYTQDRKIKYYRAKIDSIDIILDSLRDVLNKKLLSYEQDSCIASSAVMDSVVYQWKNGTYHKYPEPIILISGE